MFSRNFNKEGSRSNVINRVLSNCSHAYIFQDGDTMTFSNCGIYSIANIWIDLYSQVSVRNSSNQCITEHWKQG